MYISCAFCSFFSCIFHLWMISLFQLYSTTLLYILVTVAFIFQVKLKVSRSLKIMKGAAIRTRKLARDMLLFWKRVDKEMVSFCFLAELSLCFHIMVFYSICHITIKSPNITCYKSTFAHGNSFISSLWLLLICPWRF
jgi:hypothetical protein